MFIMLEGCKEVASGAGVGSSRPIERSTSVVNDIKTARDVSPSTGKISSN